jgi:glucokinase
MRVYQGRAGAATLTRGAATPTFGPMRILAADVGGTKTLLALYDRSEDGALQELRSERFPSADFRGIEPMAALFLGGERVDRAGIGVAGPVVDDTCRATNLPWELDARRIEQAVGISRVCLLNDFAAVALGIDALGPDDLAVLQDGEVDPQGPLAVLGAGTGLGEAIVLRDGPTPRVMSSEGGHTDFAARNEEEIALLRFLLRRHRRVSVERVVSGRGLHALYEFVVEQGLAPTTDDVRERVRTEDPGSVIGDAALRRADAACEKAVSLFVSAYGAEAGNLALTILPTGGVYLAGGIAPRLLPLLREAAFMDAFRTKGRMSPLLERMHVAVIMNTRVGLLGALRAAL